MFFILGGFLGGLVVAGIGAWKDSRWEPFRWASFWRSPILGAGWAFVLGQVFSAQPLILIVLAAMSLERVSVELWKGIIRRRPSKFRQPERDRGWLLEGLGRLRSRKYEKPPEC